MKVRFWLRLQTETQPIALIPVSGLSDILRETPVDGSVFLDRPTQARHPRLEERDVVQAIEAHR